MSRKYHVWASNIFLLEFIFSILFFLLGCAVCVPFFVQAHCLSKQAHELDCAVIESRNVSEIIRVTDFKEQALNLIQENYWNSGLTDNGIRVYYDKDFCLCDSIKAVYVLQVLFREDDDMLISHISIDHLDNPDGHIYEFELKHCLLN